MRYLRRLRVDLPWRGSAWGRPVTARELTRLAARRLTRLHLQHVLLTLVSLRGYHMREEASLLESGASKQTEGCTSTPLDTDAHKLGAVAHWVREAVGTTC
eukprot:scaffold19136_cov31-Phaeocystis_antarctica.AAC.3